MNIPPQLESLWSVLASSGVNINTTHKSHIRCWSSYRNIAGPIHLYAVNCVSLHIVDVLAFLTDARGIFTRSALNQLLYTGSNRLEATVITLGARGSDMHIRSVISLPDGTRLASTSEDGTFRTRDAERGQVISDPFEGYGVTSGPANRTAMALELKSGHTISMYFVGHESKVNPVAFSPDVVWIVSGPDDYGHATHVWPIAFCCDITRLVSGSKDQAIRIWDTQSGQCVSQPLEGLTDDVTSVAFSRDGKHIVSGPDDRSVRIWHVKAGLRRPYNRIWDGENEKTVSEHIATGMRAG
ncbi:WD40 repeat-like protein [Fomitiporia mediterranea MF3/22]|uniref:WD40 repeat-like protein n=1 Tax=Fomitiporia mediterranea (strain MF3/22) TaxID=694068 RepID=UPI0004407C64|nr:WD40 repeat-like protein [Fomitiporia mediterranea MF3/22]EJD04973.1 WD40 repeat-like protein [Fomitiporia mediterranea MF3/22]